MQSDRPLPEPGQVLSRFLLIRGLGPDEGVPAPHRTFLAFDLEAAVLVVVQVAQASPSRQGTFLRSLRNCQSLDSRDLSLPTHGEALHDQALLASTRCPGMSLRDLLRGGPLPPEAASQLLWDLAQALTSLHSTGNPHGDLHSRNVRIDSEGNPALVGWMPTPLGVPDTRPGEEAQVRRYAAPEVLLNNPPTPASDLYSLALLTLEMFSGRSLLPRGSARGTRRAQRSLQASLHKVIRLARKAPTEVQDLLKELLQFEAAHRPEDGSQVVDQLIRCLRTPLDPTRYQKLLERPLRHAATHFQRTRMRRARRALHEGKALEAASLLLEASEVTHLTGSRYRDRLRTLVRQVFWLGFLPQPGGVAGSQVLYYLLQETAGKLEDSSLAALANVRLGTFVDETSPLRALLPSLSGLGNTQRQIEGYLYTLEERPTDEQALLGLAVRTPGFRVEREEDLPRAKSDLLCHHRLFQQALFYRTQELFQDPRPLKALEEIRDLAQKAISEILESSQPALASQPPAPFDPLETYVPSGSSPDLRSMLELHLAESAPVEPLSPPPSVPSRPSGPPASCPPAPTSVPGRATSIPAPPPEELPPELDPEVLFTRAQILVCESKLEEAAGVFQQICGLGLGADSPYLVAIASEFRNLLWKNLVQPEGGCSHEALRQALELILPLGMPALQTLCEGLLLRTLPPEEKRDHLTELLRLSPTSLPFLQASSTLALEQGDQTTWGRHLLMAGWQFLEGRDLLAAAKVLMAARTTLPEETVEPALERLTALGEEIAATGELFHERLAPYQGEGQEEARLEACEGFLREYPDHLPALETSRELAAMLSKSAEVVRGVMELARRAILRDDLSAARRHLSFVLESEWHNEEALLFLVSTGPIHAQEGESVEHFRIRILEREGLFRVALQRARKLLKGTDEDRPVHQLLSRLCEQAGEDPSPHYLKFGLLSLTHRDIPAAREYLDKAIVASADPGFTVELLAQTDDISFAYSPMDLARLRSKYPLELG